MDKRNINIIKKILTFSKQTNLDGLIAKNLLKIAKNKENFYLKNIAFHANCSLSAVAKFVERKLEISSFSELKYILLTYFANVKTEEDDSIDLQNMFNNFRKIDQIYDKDKLAKIITCIYEWTNIWLVAKGDTFSIAYDLAFKLRRLSLPVHTIQVEGEIDIKKKLIKPNDGILIISNRGETKELIALAKYAKVNLIDYLIFTARDISTLALQNPLATWLVPHNEIPIKKVEILLSAKQYFTFAFDKLIYEIIDTRF